MKNLFYLLSFIVTFTVFAQDESRKHPSQEKKEQFVENHKKDHPRHNKHKPKRKHPRPAPPPQK